MGKSTSSVNIPNDYTFNIGGDGKVIQSDTELKLDPITTTSTIHSDSTSQTGLNIAPLDIKIEPLDITIEPLKASVDTNSVIDLKPLAIDSCQTLKFAPFPATCVEQPYSQHFGFTLMGVELFGFNMSGKSDVFLHSPSKSTHHTSMHQSSMHQSRRPGEHGGNCEESEPKGRPAPKSGLRVRIGDDH
jgi:hypothetical protein